MLSDLNDRIDSITLSRTGCLTLITIGQPLTIFL
uniref:Uncharacterized protein n=1 Tax=Utricularia reniformis TaxID=192314 RepID=A0A1Y0AZW2_9LAMI|nr:hypothetical protein AEK19_MT0462 [Utricularia reniformis]ART30722.1 hypothetical protein AEK19_MT0462 [Utricularia reniformis]